MDTATLTPPLQLVEEPPRAATLPVLHTSGQLAGMATTNVVTPGDLLRIAMDSGDKDIARLERLMAMDERYREMQERDRQRVAMLAFRRDFAAFRGENIIVPKSKHVDRGKAGSFDQAEFHVASGMLSPALSKHGFGVRHDPKFGSKRWMTDGVENDIPWVTVICFLEHREGHAEVVTLEGPPGELSANTPTQNMQATASYLKRQSLLAITGTATGGEDDESRLRDAQEGRPSGISDHGPEGSAEFGRLVQAGRAKSLEGMQPLTQWWGALTAAQRELVTAEFGAMRRAAGKVDADKRGAK